MNEVYEDEFNPGRLNYDESRGLNPTSGSKKQISPIRATLNKQNVSN